MDVRTWTDLGESLFLRKQTAFVLWRVSAAAPPPRVIIGRLEPGAPIEFAGEQAFDLAPLDDMPDCWTIEASHCLKHDGVYHYWFEVTDSRPGRSGARIRITDPFAFAVDWRLLAPRPAGEGYGPDDQYPPAVIKFRNGHLLPCDAGGETDTLEDDVAPGTLPANSQLVIYELPTAWMRQDAIGGRELGVGSLRDVAALTDPDEEGSNFAGLSVTRFGRAYLQELGVNALELLPLADSFYRREWGYGTTNFCAPDFELGMPADYSWPAANRDLKRLSAACHKRGIRIFADVVMGFARNSPCLAAACDDFFILDPAAHPEDPDARSSRGELRDGWGSSLFRYAHFVEGSDPVSGRWGRFSPARQLMKASLWRWMNDFHVDGFRMDSVENVANWDFIQEYREFARTLWQQRYVAQSGGDGADERFLVVGEELHEPLDLLRQHRLDGLWHENFKRYIRSALLGQGAGGDDFEWTVRKAIDCRHFGYGDLAQAIIYLTSHDVEGPRNERLFNFLQNNGIGDTRKRIELGFACLLTAVGIPMILAGEEFADQHDLFDRHGNVSQSGGKQVDPVNFSRLDEPWRAEVKEYVARLIRLRTDHPALAVNDTDFIHADFNDGKRVLVWRRGRPGNDDPVVVVANFSDFGTADPSQPWAEYRVPNWPATPAGKRWREVTRDRDVPPEWIGREPVFPWEAKVYTLV
jgi:1,4-alpha-glucan branching enzyme